MTTRFQPDTDNNYWLLSAVLVFSVTIMVLYTFPVQEGDFFWHVRTGQWIWEHKSLPSADPFSYVNRFTHQTGHVAERTQFILKQYWLGQLALFAVWKAGGEAGMVILRAIVYGSILAFIHQWTTREKNGLISFATIFVVGNILANYSSERPQIFAFLFVVFMYYLLEQLITGKTGHFKRHATLLATVMLLWSNCHGSFILGIIVIVLYLLSHLLMHLFRGDILCPKMLAVLSGSALITYINPNGFAAFTSVFEVKKEYTNIIAEYASPVKLAMENHVFDYWYWFLLATALVTIIIHIRTMALRHIMVIGATAALSLTAVRYIPFFVLTAPLIALSLPDRKPEGRYRLLPLLVLLIWLGTRDFQNVLKFRAAKTFPKGAISFLNTAKPSGNIFNSVFWGGYLMCYTNIPVFADGRGLAENFTQLEHIVLSGDGWRGPLNFFQINTIFIPGMNQILGKPYPLLLQLLRDNDWVLVYQDDEALVFIKNMPRNADIISRYAISKDRIAKHIIDRQKWLSEGRL